MFALGSKRSFGFLWFQPPFVKKGMTHRIFAVPVFLGVICVLWMEKHGRFTFALEVASEVWNFCGLNPIFLKKKVDPCNFRCFRSPGG